MYLECPYCDADQKHYLDNDDEKLHYHLGDEQLGDIDPCNPGTVQKTFVSLHQKCHCCQTDGEAKCDTG